MAERFLYLPAIGLVASFVIGVFALARRANLERLAPIALAILVAALGARTIVRNVDWQDDVTLSRATVAAVPGSYKAHRMLAGALFAADPARSNIDEVVSEAERSLAILEPLADRLNDGELYMQAGGYYIARAERPGAGAAGPAADALGAEQRADYERAIALLRKAETIGTAQRDAGHGTRFARHFADVYDRLSLAHLRLGDARQAFEAAVRARGVDPLGRNPYARMADALLAAGRLDEAAIALTEGLVMTAHEPFAQALVKIYSAGLDPERCAVVGTGSAATLNPRCPSVRRHLCEATEDLLPALLEAGLRDRAARLKSTAVGQFGCASAPLDALLPGT